jgi:predicted nucleic acid-binding protein
LTYCVDTSTFIEAGTRTYPIDIAPGLWDEFDRLATDGTICSPEEVRLELRAKSDALAEWIKDRPQLFVDLDGEQMVATHEVLAQFPKLAGKLSNRYHADPFVVALARVRGLTVVTEENPVSTPERPRIPLVCQHFGVRCINLLAWIRELEITVLPSHAP